MEKKLIPDGMTALQVANMAKKEKYRMKKVSMMSDAIVAADVKKKLMGLD